MAHRLDTSDKHVNRIVQLLFVLFTLIFVFLLCFCVYWHDNQYTAKGPQPDDGVLDLRNVSFNTHSPTYHLHKNWKFYPNVLLMPDEDPSSYPYSLYSLQETSHDLLDCQGTYELTILLPDTPMLYSIRLPSTFAAYRLYVNDNLVLSNGFIDNTENNDEMFKGQIFTIRASEKIRLLLHYSDNAGISNGMSAPPVFGTPLRVYSITEYRQNCLIAAMVLILLTMFLSIIVYFRSQQGSNLALVILCLCALIYLAYPLLRSKMMFPAYPWYQLSIACYFGCHAAVHWIYSLHFGWKDRTARFVNWYSIAAVGVCASILLALVILPKESGWKLYLGGIRILQWGAILCGILLTLRMIFSGNPNYLMGTASVTIWAFLLVDLISPDFSPVIFARFPEMGIICFMIISICIEYVDVASAHHFRILYAQKIAHAEQFLKLEEHHYARLYAQVEESRQFRHDLRQHLRVIRTLLDQNDSKALAAYLEQYEQNVQPLLETPMTFFQIPVVDALIAYYWTAAQEIGAEFSVKGQLQELPQSVYVDFCSILGNLLENALEALKRQDPEHPKWIRVRCEIQHRKLMLEISNSNFSPVQQKGNRFQSTKHDDLGTGTLSVSIIAQQYGGFASFSHNEDCFNVQVLLPLSGVKQDIKQK